MKSQIQCNCKNVPIVVFVYEMHFSTTEDFVVYCFFFFPRDQRRQSSFGKGIHLVIKHITRTKFYSLFLFMKGLIQLKETKAKKAKDVSQNTVQ